MGKKKNQPSASSAQKSGVAIDRRSAVRISDIVEQKIKLLLTSVKCDDSSAHEVSKSLTEKRAASRLFSVYKSLMEFGFLTEQIKNAIRNLPRMCVSLDVALDWLMLNVAVDELPKCFTSHAAVFSTRNIIEVVKTSNAGLSSIADPIKHNAKLQTAQETKPSQTTPMPQKNDRSEQGYGVSKEWIMQYCEEESEDGDSLDADEREESHAEADWELWSDPREVERRRHERKSGPFDVLSTVAMVTEELKRVKEAAALAKKTKDKAKQKQTGLMIQALKAELAELERQNGLPVGQSFDREKQKEQKVEKEASDDEPSLPPGDLFDVEEPITKPDTPVLAQSQTEAPENGAVTEEEDGFDLGGTLFDEDAEWEVKRSSPLFDHSPRPELQVPPSSTAQITPEGREIDLALERWRKANTPVKVDHQRLPKFVLTQTCQKRKWSLPAFAKIPSSHFLQSVSVTVPKQGKKGSDVVESGVHKIVVPLEYNPASVQEAQNCVAIVALMKLFPELNLDFTFQQPYREVHYQLKQHSAIFENMEEDEIEKFIEEIVKDGGFQKQTEDETRSSPHPTLNALANPFELTSLSNVQRFQRPKPKLDEQLHADLLRFQSSKAGRKWCADRAALPVHSIKTAVLGTLDRCHSLVVVGDTGCGKTTQIPQFVYEHAVLSGCGSLCSILITQPRRLAAVSVAHRVAEEMGQPRPVSQRDRSRQKDDKNSTHRKVTGLVGYHVRLDAAVSKETRLTFCTTGILLRLLSGDPLLSTVTHVVVDEVHERTMHSDFLLAILKDLIAVREQMGYPLKVVVMSATLDAEMFSKYLECPQLTTLGRTFPVDVSFLEDIYEKLQYKLDPDSGAAMRFGRSDPSLKSSIRSQASTKWHSSKVSGSAICVLSAQIGEAVVRVQLGERDVRATGCTKQELQRRALRSFADLSACSKRSLQLVNEDRIDFDLIEELVVDIDRNQDEGAVLLFLPGMYEINAVYDRLSSLRRFDRDWIIRLHSSLTPEEQARAFAIPPKRPRIPQKSSKPTLADYIDKEALNATAPVVDATPESEKEERRVRKVVISTNIAETSLTISDVVYVIDSGKLRERQFDASKGISSLLEGWISQASAKQRKGRAGRVRDGFAFCLFTKHRFRSKMDPFQVPEIMRMPLEEIVLQIHALKLGRSGKFLETLPQPPDANAIDLAVKNLTQIGALEPEVEVLTPLGRILATLPIDARIGKLLVYASYFGCLSSALTLAAAMGERSVFNTTPDAQGRLSEIKRRFAIAGPKNAALGQQSDHLVIIAAFHEWLDHRLSRNPSAAHRYAVDHLLHEPTLETIRTTLITTDKQQSGALRIQFAEILVQAKLIPDLDNIWSIKKEEPSMIRALLSASMYPNFCTLEESEAGSSSAGPYWSDGRNKVELHKTSVNADLAPTEFHYPYIAYLEKVMTRGLVVRECTVISPISLLLFGGSLHVEHRNNAIVIDDRVRIRAAAPVAVMFKKLRLTLDDLILKKIENPQAGHDAEDQVLDIIKTLLVDEEHIRKKRI